METFWISTGAVAIAEVGDKTQLLALILAARFGKPLVIIVGIFLATIINHALAGAVGTWLTLTIEPQWLQWLLGLSFIAMAGWTLIPDTVHAKDAEIKGRFGVLGATFILFFLAEMGDKTQVATVVLAAQFDSPVTVVLGTTLGMLIANAPAVLLGNIVLQKIPIRLFRYVAAGLFAVIGLWILLM
jgi:putative Ca2+/H+ antiporter (TMEM165/GDT1 family)